MVRALEDIERHRPKLFIFFFIRAPMTFAIFDRDKVRDARAMLTGEFISYFPTFVREQLPNSILQTHNGGQDE